MTTDNKKLKINVNCVFYYRFNKKSLYLKHIFTELDSPIHITNLNPRSNMKKAFYYTSNILHFIAIILKAMTDT